MQINFTPKKIKEAKAYIENLDSFLKSRDKNRKKSSKKISFFARIKRFFS